MSLVVARVWSWAEPGVSLRTHPGAYARLEPSLPLCVVRSDTMMWLQHSHLCTDLQAVSTFMLRPKSWVWAFAFYFALIFCDESAEFSGPVWYNCVTVLLCASPCPTCELEWCWKWQMGVKFAVLLLAWKTCVLKTKTLTLHAFVFFICGESGFYNQNFVGWTTLAISVLYFGPKTRMTCSLYLDYRHSKHNVINTAFLNPWTIHTHTHTSQVFSFPFMLTRLCSTSEFS